MTIYKDLYSTMNWQDGQEVALDFLNNGKRFLRAQMTDQLLQQLIGDMSNAAIQPEFGADGGGDASTLWAYCMNPGRAFLRQGSANNKIQLAPGTLLQKIANADGNDSTLVPFTFGGTEEWTIANGDATNPRVDLLQMKISYTTDTLLTVDFQDAVTRALTSTPSTATRYRPQAELTVTQGTPAASPTIPDPDTGFVPVGMVVVGHNWTSAGNAPIFGVDTAEANNVVVLDQRMPMNVRAFVVEPALYNLETAWALSNANQYALSSSGTNRLFVPCPAMLGRLVGLEIHYTNAATHTLSLGLLVNDLTSAPSAKYTTRNTAPASFTTALDSTTYDHTQRAGFEAGHLPAAGPTIQPSAVKGYGVPLWTTGYRVATRQRGVFDRLALSVTNQTNATAIAGVGFLVAV